MSSTQNSYTWGANCIAYIVLQTPGLSVKREIMPANTSETLHMHQHAQQLFYVLKGIATFCVDDKTLYIEEGNSIHILRGQRHFIANRTGEPLEILVISQPDTAGDRISL